MEGSNGVVAMKLFLKLIGSCEAVATYEQDGSYCENTRAHATIPPYMSFEDLCAFLFLTWPFNLDLTSIEQMTESEYAKAIEPPCNALCEPIEPPERFSNN